MTFEEQVAKALDIASEVWRMNPRAPGTIGTALAPRVAAAIEAAAASRWADNRSRRAMWFNDAMAALRGTDDR